MFQKDHQCSLISTGYHHIKKRVINRVQALDPDKTGMQPMSYIENMNEYTVEFQMRD